MEELSPIKIVEKRTKMMKVDNIIKLLSVPIFIISFTIIELNISLIWNLLAILIIFGPIYINKRYKMRYKKGIYNILFSQCDPEKYKQIYQLFLKEKISGSSRDIINIELAKADYFLGNFKGGKSLLENINLQHKNIIIFIAYYTLLSYYYLSLHDKEGLLKTYEKMQGIEKELSNEKRFRKGRIEVYNKGIKEINTNISILENEVTLIDLLSKEIREAETKLQKVRLNYYIGIKYYELGNFQLSKKHLNYVVDKGNITFYVREAKEVLMLMNS